MDSSSPVMSLLYKGEGLTATPVMMPFSDKEGGCDRSLPPPSSWDTPKSPSKKRLFGFFPRCACVCVCVCVCLSVSLCLYAASNVHSANTLCIVECCLPVVVCMYLQLGSADFSVCSMDHISRSTACAC